MDFDFTEEQRLLDESVRRLVKDEYDIRQAQELHGASLTASARALWAHYAELGLLGLPFAETWRLRRRRRSRP